MVDKDGQVNSYYPPATDPLTIVPDIEKLLKKWVNNSTKENLQKYQWFESWKPRVNF